MIERLAIEWIGRNLAAPMGVCIVSLMGILCMVYIVIKYG